MLMLYVNKFNSYRRLDFMLDSYRTQDLFFFLLSKTYIFNTEFKICYLIWYLGHV